MGVAVFFKKTKKLLFWFFLISFFATLYTRDMYRQAEDIESGVFKEPVQSAIAEKDTIIFEKDDYLYELTPVYDYEISALVVNRFDYTLFTIYKRDSVFPLDLCVIWGSNVKSGVYKDSDLSFSQDMRFCFYEWRGDIVFNSNEISNNHLVINDEAILKIAKKIRGGDQIKIKGKLVNVKAENVGSAGKYDPEEFSMNTSVVRNDTGAGACEIIYVESLEITKKENFYSFYLHEISKYGLLFILGWVFLSLIIDAFWPKTYLR
jgi:hypothetical protein